MKRNPGEWLREKILDKALQVGMFTVAGASLLVGTAHGLWLTGGFATASAWELSLASFPVIALFAIALGIGKGPWRLRNMQKGARAEESVGQAIEYALTMPCCAAAHHVREIAKYGDIDHLVATPAGLWVIETKSGRIPRKRFREALGQIAANVAAVRDWAPETRVTGCLVFNDHEGHSTRPAYDSKGETIQCFENREELARALRKEARMQCSDRAALLARRVWKLAKVEPASNRTA